MNVVTVEVRIPAGSQRDPGGARRLIKVTPGNKVFIDFEFFGCRYFLIPYGARHTFASRHIALSNVGARRVVGKDTIRLLRFFEKDANYIGD